MKYITLLFLLLPFSLYAQQCTIQDNHSNNTNDSWQSCQTTTNPNPNRPNSHWLLYDLGALYSLGATTFWNYNIAGETNKGMRSVVIDYSQDGMTWTEAASFQLGQATGNTTYTGEDGPHLGEIDAQYILITSLSTWGNGCAGLGEVRFAIEGTVTNNPPKIIQAKVLLEGAYVGSGLMHTTLLNQGLLPTAQPFNRAPWNYTGTEAVTNIPAAVTDWVLLEVKENTAPYQTIAQGAAFLRNDGQLIALNGTLGVPFLNLQDNTNYTLVVRSRNHLAITNATAIVLPQMAAYDFTVEANVLGGNSQVHSSGDGFHTMIAGDFNSDGVITVADFNHFRSEAALSNQFLDGDGNLDGNVTVDDFNVYVPNASVIGVFLVRY